MISLTHTQLLIDGRWTDSASGRVLSVINPATGLPVGTLPLRALLLTTDPSQTFTEMR